MKSRIKIERSVRSALSVLIICATAPFGAALPALACAPVFPQAVMVNGTHPDFPLKLFAAGNLGIIQPGWARSYLCVVYRYLNDKPLSASEQRSIVRLWHRRLINASLYTGELGFDEIEKYLDLRAKVTGIAAGKTPSLYSTVDSYRYSQKIGLNAFAVARETLGQRINKYGLKSAQVREWLRAQDIVFGISPGKIRIPQPLLSSADPLQKADRAYQIAAATFYANDIPKAESLFLKIAQDKSSPWSKLASYMVARCKTNLALNSKDAHAVKAAISCITDALRENTDEVTGEDLLDLQRPLTYMGRPGGDLLKELASKVSTGNSARFGGDVGDITYLLDEGASTGDGTGARDNRQTTNTPDLTDWLLCMQSRDDECSYYSEDEQKKFKTENEERSKHSLEMWRKTKTIPWLVAAVSANGLEKDTVADLKRAALKVPAGSKAFLTMRYYLADEMIKSGKSAEARAQLLKLLGQKDLPPSSRNLFSMQMGSASESADQYLIHSVQAPAGICSDFNLLPANFMDLEKRADFHVDPARFDETVAGDLNKNLPLSLWVRLARDRSLNPQLRGLLLRATWLRAHLANRKDVAKQLEPDLAVAAPVIAPALRKYQQANSSDARRFLLASLILRFYGMSPYLDGGVERHGLPLQEFDWYNANFWLPLQSGSKQEEANDASSYDESVVFAGSDKIRAMMNDYSKKGIDRFLTPQQRAEAAEERNQIANNHPSRFLGEPVLRWAATHPADPSVPELLYRINRLPKWSGQSKTGSEYSKKAYTMLHSRFAGNQWTRKAVCWY